MFRKAYEENQPEWREQKDFVGSKKILELVIYHLRWRGISCSTNITPGFQTPNQ